MNEVTTITSARTRRSAIATHSRKSRWSGPLSTCADALAQEGQRRLVPAGVERNEPGIAVPLERAYGAVGRHEAQHGRDALPQPADVGVDGEAPGGAGARVLEVRIERALFPQHLQPRVERTARQAGARRRDALERAVRGQRQPHRSHGDGPQSPAVFGQPNRLRQPHRRGVPEGRLHALEVHVSGATRRHVHVAHRGQRDPYQERDAVASRLQERLDRDVVRDVVGGGGAAESQESRG